jgi:nucleoside-diphosphate kinase
MKKFLSILLTMLVGAFAQAVGAEAQTLSIIKPDAVAANHIGEIIARFEKAGLKVAAAKMTRLSKSEAESFYAVHKERPFYKDLVAYMSSGPIFVQVLEGSDAVNKNRELMGATDPKKAAKGTIRADFGTDVQSNAVHGSDSVDNAKTEIAFFFKPSEIYSR